MSKKSIGFGFRGWIVLIYQFFAFICYVTINNFGQNVMANVNAGVLGWNPTLVPTVYTVAIVISVLFQFIAGKKLANSGHIRTLSIVFLGAATVLTVFTAVYKANYAVWLIVWGLSVLLSIIGATFFVSTIVGQWFPRRKGTVMGIATLAFPVINGVGLTVFSNMLRNARGNMLIAWLPWLIIDVIAILLCIFFVKEYPEQCGAFPDNDRSMTPEAARALMEKQIVARRNSVWTMKNMARTPDYWLITIPQGILLLGSIGAMTQVMTIMAQFGLVVDHATTAVGSVVFLCNAAIACLGSWLLGIVDTKYGTKLAILISSLFMIVSGVLCCIGTVSNSAPIFLVGFACLQIFMGASSNFTVSSAAQYWRREDFPSAFSFINPLANLLSAFGPIIVAGVGAAFGFRTVWVIIAVFGVICSVLTAAFKPSRILVCDKKYRKEAGLSEEGLSKSAAELISEK